MSLCMSVPYGHLHVLPPTVRHCCSVNNGHIGLFLAHPNSVVPLGTVLRYACDTPPVSLLANRAVSLSVDIRLVLQMLGYMM